MNFYEEIQEYSNKIIENLSKVIIGKKNTLEFVTLSLLAQGHVLIDDVPGVGKTMLAKALAKTIGCEFSRIQFTPDMLPSDVTGISIYDQAKKKFEFRPGPVFTNILLADEINRATPKTQSALLEAMEERQITVDGITHQLIEPFVVLATQNPIEYEGTFPLPEAQLDRFFMKIQIGYPSLQDEIRIIDYQRKKHPIENITPVIDSEETKKLQRMVKDVFITESLDKYIVQIIRNTRENKDIYLGCSPRGSLALSRASQIYAAMSGRDYVLPDDIKYLAVPILSHRIILQPTSRLKNITTESIIEDILYQTEVPGGKFTRDILT
jgi:MoxR-like ATPase